MRYLQGFLVVLLLNAFGCAANVPTDTQTASCPLRPTTEAKRFEVIGEPWIVISVMYPLNARVECVGDSKKRLERVVARMTEIVKNRKLQPDEYYGVGKKDCVCKGGDGYIAVMQHDTAVIYCLPPEDS